MACGTRISLSAINIRGMRIVVWRVWHLSFDASKILFELSSTTFQNYYYSKKMSSAATHWELTARFAAMADHRPAGPLTSQPLTVTVYIVVVSLWVVQSRHQADLFNVTRAQEDEPPTERRPKNRSDFLISIPNMNDLLWQFQIFDTNATIHRVKAAACHGD